MEIELDAAVILARLREHRDPLVREAVDAAYWHVLAEQMEKLLDQQQQDEQTTLG